MSGWTFRFIDSSQRARQSREFLTKEAALKEGCEYNRQGNAVTSLEGPAGERLTSADVAAWCAKKADEKANSRFR